MNKEIFKGRWNQMKGSAKKQWGRLTEDDLAQINGDYDKLVGVIQERYGKEKDEADREIDQFFKQITR